MKLEYTQRFLKDIQKIDDISIKRRIDSTIDNCKKAKNPKQI